MTVWIREIVKLALENGIISRCHFEDMTRADFYGLVVPNDFYKVVINFTTAWLYDASYVNNSLLGIGERTEITYSKQ